MLNTTFDVISKLDYNKAVLTVDYRSVQGVCAAGTTQSLDFTLTDDMMLYGLQLLAKGSYFGDTVTLQVVCISGTLANGVTICPPNYVLKQFGTNIGVCDDTQTKIDVAADFPAKLLGGMTIRCIYTSTGPSPVNIIVNYKLLDILQ